ncbi:MAG: hypothetical protein R3F46_03420 [bacterium]
MVVPLLCAGCSSGVPSVEYQVPVVREMEVFHEPLIPGYTALVRYRIGMEKVSIPLGTDFTNTARPLEATVSEGEIVPLLPAVYDGNGDAPDFAAAQAAWQALGTVTASGTEHPAYQSPFIWFLYRAPTHVQNVRIELNLGNDGGPGNRIHSDNILVQWPYD